MRRTGGSGIASAHRPAVSFGGFIARGGAETAAHSREPTWGDDYDYDSWDRGDVRAPAGGAADGTQDPGQDRRFAAAVAGRPAAWPSRIATAAERGDAQGRAAPHDAWNERDGCADGPFPGVRRRSVRYGGDRSGPSSFPASLLLPRTPQQLRARADVRSAGRSEVEVAGYDMEYGADNQPYDDEVMVVDEDPSPASYRNSRFHSARRELDTGCGRQLPFRPQNIDPRDLAELVNSGGALAFMSRRGLARACTFLQ